MRSALPLALLIALPIPGLAQDRTGRVQVQTPRLASPGYLQIEDIDGESRDEGHDKWIDVISFQWSSGAVPAPGRSGGPGELVLTRRMDTTSPRLVERIAGGERLPRMVVHAPRAAGEETYLAIELENVRITSYSISAAQNIPTESITFHYEKIDVQDGPVVKGKKILQN